MVLAAEALVVVVPAEDGSTSIIKFEGKVLKLMRFRSIIQIPLILVHMKKPLSLCAFLLLFSISFSQKVHFIYLQTEDQVPFYVRLNGKVHSSSGTGYLILPKLVDSTYILNIGFAKSEAPESTFAVAIDQKDKGLLLKRFQDGLSLFDLQALNLLKPLSAEAENTAYKAKTDKFTELLSKAAKDPALLKVPVPVKEERTAESDPKKITTINPDTLTGIREDVVQVINIEQVINVEKKDSVSANLSKENNTDLQENIKTVDKSLEGQAEVIVDNKEPQQPVPAEPYQRSKVSRYSESSTTEGFGLIYFDNRTAGTDTIRILIPPSKTFIASNEEPASRFISREEINNKVQEETKASATDSIEKVSTSVCNDEASEKDFLKLRKNMAGEVSDNGMISQSNKVFRKKCFSVEQIKNLSALFLTSAGKYNFFKEALPSVSNKKDFSTLRNELTDDYYAKLFDQLIQE